MPDTIRRSGGFARPWLGGFALAIAVGFPVCVRAEEPPRLALHELVLGASHSIGSHEVAALALLVGLLLFSVVTANMLLRARARWARLERSAQENNAALRAALDRANALLASEPQVIVDWPAGSDEPSIEGDAAIVGVAALDQVLAFGAWLEPAKADAMERSIELLRARGEAFSVAFTTLGGRPIEVQGRAIAGRAVLRLKDAGGIKRELVDLAERHQALRSDVSSLRALVEKLPLPVWICNAAGRLTFVNAAYAHAVEAPDSDTVVGKRDRAVRQPRPRHHCA